MKRNPRKKILLKFILFCMVLSVFFIFPLKSFSGKFRPPRPTGTEMNWYDGKQNHRIWLSENEIAYFPKRGKNIKKKKIREMGEDEGNVNELNAYRAILTLKKKESRAGLEARMNALSVNPQIQCVSPVFYRGSKSHSNRKILTGEIIVLFPQKMSVSSLQAFALRYGVRVVRQFPFANAAVFFAGQGFQSLDTADRIARSGEVLYAYPNWLHEMTKKADPLFAPNQWNLSNTGQGGGTPGEDANVSPVWLTYKGSVNEVIAIVDDGLELTHEDLSANVIPNMSFDWVGGDTDPTPDTTAGEFHGTAVGGIAAARGGNGLGIEGTAPNAGLVGFRLLGAVTDANEADAMTRDSQTIDIYNNSWGPGDTGELAMPGPLFLAALKNGVENGRGGLGSIYVWAAGNGLAYSDNSNYDGYANSRYTIAVTGTTNQGGQSNFSEPGANILINAPSGGGGGGNMDITTTDITGLLGFDSSNYTDSSGVNSFTGTSASAPLVSGVIALILQARPGVLSWRDIQQILLSTATKNSPGDADWIQNGAGFWINHKFGFGRINAKNAVDSALVWTSVGKEDSITQTSAPGIVIPDNNATGVTDTITMVDTRSLKIEYVEVTFNSSDHRFWGDLEVTLTSPMGTKSILAESHNPPSNVGSYTNWVFGSVRHFGETVAGDWSLTVKDLAPGDIGTFQNWTLRVFGTFPSSSSSDTTPPLVLTSSSGSGDTSLLANATDTILLVLSASDTRSGIQSVTVDLQGIGGSSAQALFNDGTNGDTTAGDSFYSVNISAAVSASLGDTQLVYTVKDNSGNSAIGGTITIGIFDGALPRLAIDTPVLSGGIFDTSSSIILIGGTTFRINTGESVALFVNGIFQDSAIVLTGGGFSGTVSVSSVNDVISAKAFDTFFQLADDSITVNLDTTSPIINIIAPVSDSFSSSGIFYLLGIVSDSFAAPNTVTLSVPGKTDSSLIVSGGIFQGFFSLTIGGVNVISVTSADTAGNIGTDTLLLLFDTDPPLVLASGTGEGDTVVTANNLDTLLLTVLPFDSASGVKSVTVNLSGIGGGSAASLFNDGTNGDTLAGDSFYSLIISAAFLTSPGDTNLVFTLSDSVGNFFIGGTIVINIAASTFPVLIINSPVSSGGTLDTSSSVIQISGTVTGIGIGESVSLWVNGVFQDSIPVLFGGLFSGTVNIFGFGDWVSAMAVDPSLQTASDSFRVNLDTLAPSVIILTPVSDSGSSGGIFLLTGTLSSGPGNPDSVTVSISGLPDTSLSAASGSFNALITIVQAGFQNIIVTATDTALNVGTASISLWFDTDPPLLIGSGTGNNDTSAAANGSDTLLITLVGVDTGAGIQSVTVDLSGVGGSALASLVNDGTHGDTTAGDSVFSLIITISASTPTGNTVLVFVITDTAGNRVTGGTLTIEALLGTAPSLSFLTPVSSGGIFDTSGTLILVGGTVAGIPVGANVNLFVNGVLQNTVLVQSGSIFSGTISISSIGDSISALAFDSFLQSASDTISLRQDTAAPVLSSVLISPSTVNNDSSTLITLTLIAQDNLSPASSLTITADLSGLGPSFSSSQNLSLLIGSIFTSTFIADSSLTGGVFLIPVTATDSSGNTSSSNFSFTVNDVSPSVTTFLSPFGISDPVVSLSGGSVSLSIQVPDTVASVRFQYRASGSTGTFTTINTISLPTGAVSPVRISSSFNVDSIALPSLQVQAMPLDSLGNPLDPSPSSLTLIVDTSGNAVINENQTSNGEHVLTYQVTSVDTPVSFRILNGDGLDASASVFTLPVTLTFKEFLANPPPLPQLQTLKSIGRMIEITTSTGQKTFDTSVEVAISYNDINQDGIVDGTSIKESDLRMYFHNENNGIWMPVDFSQDISDSNLVIGRMKHFTVFAIFADTVANNLDNLIIYPNPFKPNDGDLQTGIDYSASDLSSGIIFNSLPLNSSIQIYNLLGKKVSEFSVNFTAGNPGTGARWDVKNDQGEKVASGVYFAIVKDAATGQKKIRKILVIR